ncbi:MAG: hypothetical protein QM778_35230 [Myxococcales bacterium]
MVDRAQLHEDGQGIVQLERELAELQQTLTKHKIKPAACSNA